MLRTLVTTAALALAVASPAFAAGDVVVKESRLSVKETIDRLAAALDQKGIKVVARVDHAAGAKAAGMELPPTELLIFGNPKLGTPLIKAAPTAGLDLPMKVLAWQTADGKVKVAYTAPGALVTRHAVNGADAVVAEMAKALDTLTNAATGAAPAP